MGFLNRPSHSPAFLLNFLNLSAYTVTVVIAVSARCVDKKKTIFSEETEVKWYPVNLVTGTFFLQKSGCRQIESSRKKSLENVWAAKSALCFWLPGNVDSVTGERNISMPVKTDRRATNNTSKLSFGFYRDSIVVTSLFCNMVY